MANKIKSKSRNIKPPTEKQLLARQKFAEQAKNRSKMFEVEVRLNDKVYISKTNDIASSLEELGKTIKAIRTRMFLIVRQGNKKAESILFVNKVRQLFRNKFFRDIFVRKLNFK